MANAFQRGVASAWYWRLAAFRCLIYGLMVSWPVFKAGVEGYERYSDMSDMQHAKLYGDMAIAFFGVLIAFFDSSIQKLSSAKEAQDQPTKIYDQNTPNIDRLV